MGEWKAVIGDCAVGQDPTLPGKQQMGQVDCEISLQKSVKYEWMDSPIGAVGTLLFQSSHLKKSEIAI